MDLNKLNKKCLKLNTTGNCLPLKATPNTQINFVGNMFSLNF